ncbi:MAG: T9SS type A sorting domain-containing protein [Prevotellaceae bacterium]|jgi:hypothetical protein|nr:T9SS type A sorting domain-containing protein [Prevotellaceae bacterium]
MKARKKILFGWLLAGATIFGLQPLSAKVLYVGNTSTTWAGKPAEDVKSTIAEAVAAATSGDSVWVAAGDYSIAAPITIKAGVSLYGGFAGTESSVEERARPADAQPWEFVNVTKVTSKTSNVFTTIANIPITDNTTIDGFTVEGHTTSVGVGVGSYAIYYNNAAGGIIVRNTVIQNTCKNATGNNDHGGIGVKGPDCLVEYCLIQGNKGKNGGGAYVERGTLRNSVIRNNCTVTDGSSSAGNANPAGNGGGVFLLSSGKVYNCLLEGNTATFGGAAFMGNEANALFYNNVVVNNTASKSGGGISYDSRNATGGLVYNVIVANNTSGTSDGGGGISIETNGRIYNSIIYNNKDVDGKKVNISIANGKTPTLKNNISDADWSAYGTGNIEESDSSKIFGARWIPLANFAGVDRGTEDGITLSATDITGDSRKFNDTVDIGPYEVQPKKVSLTCATGVTVKTNPLPTTAPFNGEYVVEFAIPAGIPAVTVTGSMAKSVSKTGNDEYKLTVGNIVDSIAIHISFIQPVVVTIEKGAGVELTYPGSDTSVTVEKDSLFVLRFTAAGYKVTRVYVDAVEVHPVEASGVYTVSVDTVSKNITIRIETQVIVYRIAISASPAEGGTVGFASPDSGVLGDSITVVAAANPKYEFTGWTNRDDSVVVSTNNAYTFSVSDNDTLTGHFRRLSSETKLLLLRVNGVVRQPETGDSVRYKVYLSNNTAAVVAVEATASPRATINANDLGERNLTSDSTELTITVTAEDGAAVVYTLTVIRSSDKGSVTAAEATSAGTLQIYPNPTTGAVYVEVAGGQRATEVKVYSLLGKLLKTTTSGYVDLSEYPAGVYLLQAEGQTGKVIKQ